MKKPRQFKPIHGGTGLKFNGRKNIDDLYDSAWSSYRARFLHINSTCYCCGNKALVVDHLVPHKGDEILFKKLDNHIPLCIVCHNTITAKFDRNHKVGNTITAKLTWMAGVRARNLIVSRVKVLSSYV